MSISREYCKRGHLMAETRRFNKSGDSFCEVCRKDRYDSRRNEDPELFKKRVFESRLKKFGMTENDYKDLYDKQSGRCAICQKHSSEYLTRLSIDHCHSENKVRGLLCLQCNTALGSFKDNVEYLARARDYLIMSIER